MRKARQRSVAAKSTKAKYDASTVGKLRKKAGKAVRKAIAAGDLMKEPCEKCKATDVWPEYKCGDYHDPTIGIRWFCPHCYLARRKSESSESYQ